MGILSNLLQKYTAEDEVPVAADNGVAPQQQSSTTSQNEQLVSNTPRSTLVTDELEEKMRSNPRARAVRQLSLFVAGATFFTLSALITRRAVTRKLMATRPRAFTPSNYQPKDANGAFEAAEALGLATLNVGSAAMMLTGGAMFALDITSVEDMRTKFKHRMGFDQSDRAEADADAEIEEWVKTILDKKDGGDNKGIAEGLTALVGVLAGKEEEKEKLRKMQEEADKNK